MNCQSFSGFKKIIGITLLLGMLGVGLMSTWYMVHGATAHQGCVGVGGGMPPCVSLTNIASCLRAHLGVIQTISQAVPTYVNQLLVLFVLAATLWFWFREKRGEPDALSRLRLRWQNFSASLNVLFQKIEQWLTLHEKRDPAPATFMVLRVLFVPIM